MTEENEPRLVVQRRVLSRSVEQLKAQLAQAEDLWLKEHRRRLKQDKMLEACLEVIKHLQNRA